MVVDKIALNYAYGDGWPLIKLSKNDESDGRLKSPLERFIN